MLSILRCAPREVGSCFGVSGAFSRYFVRRGGLRSGFSLVDLVNRMAYPLVRVDPTLTRGKALL